MEYSHKDEALRLYKTLSIIDPKDQKDPVSDSSNPQIIFADNQGAIKLSKNPQHHNRTKHIDVKFDFIRESSQNGLIQLAYIPTDEMVADILTKSLPRDRHEKHMKG